MCLSFTLVNQLESLFLFSFSHFKFVDGNNWSMSTALSLTWVSWLNWMSHIVSCVVRWEWIELVGSLRYLNSFRFGNGRCFDVSIGNGWMFFCVLGGLDVVLRRLKVFDGSGSRGQRITSIHLCVGRMVCSSWVLDAPEVWCDGHSRKSIWINDASNMGERCRKWLVNFHGSVCWWMDQIMTEY